MNNNKVWWVPTLHPETPMPKGPAVTSILWALLQKALQGGRDL